MKYFDKLVSESIVSRVHVTCKMHVAYKYNTVTRWMKFNLVVLQVFPWRNYFVTSAETLF